MSYWHNRRVYPRLPVDLGGEVRFGKDNPRPCRIRDLCLNGLLLQGLPKELPNPQLGMTCQIIFALPLPAGSRRVKAEAEVAHGVEQGFGLRFLQLHGDSLTYLETFINALATPHTAAIAALPSQWMATIVQPLLAAQLPDLLKSLAIALQEALWAATEQVKTNAERTELNESLMALMRALRQPGWQANWCQDLLSNPSAADPHAETLPETEMALIDTQIFDLWLAGSALIQRLEMQLDQPLRSLRLLAIAVLGPGNALSIEPAGFVRSLRQALINADLGIRGQLLGLQIADTYLVTALRNLYQNLIIASEVAGITPATTATPARLPITTVAHAQPNSAVPNTAATPPIAADSKPPIEAHNNPTPLPSAAQLAAWLATETVAAPTAIMPPLREQLANIAPTLIAAGSLPAALEQRINATDHVLHHMLADPLLPRPLKNLIQRLSLRFLGASLNTPDFYQETTAQPLLELLNQLERLFVFFPEQTTSHGAVRPDLEQLLQQVAKLDLQDSSQTQALSHQAELLQQQLNGELQRQSNRLVARYAAKERVRLIHQTVRQRINEVFTGHPMQPAIADLITQAWHPLLQLIGVREGVESENWRNYWQTLLDVYRLSHSTAPPLPDESVAKLLENLSQGLNFMGLDPYRRTRLLDGVAMALKTAGLAALRDTDNNIFQPLLASTLDTLVTTKVTQITAPEIDSMDADWIAIDNLEIGGYLRWCQAEKELLLRLVWRNSEGNERVFIDPATLETQVLGRTSLAAAYQCGELKLHPTPEQPLTIRATEAALQEMQARIDYHEIHDAQTGLHNRRHLLSSVTQVASQSADAFIARVLGLVHLTVFDAVSSACGYAAGERLLIAVTKLLQNLLEDADCLAYVGGGRFALLALAADAELAKQLGGQVRSELMALPFYWQGKAYPISGGIGLVHIAHPSDNPETLLSEAEAACLAAQPSSSVVLFQAQDERIIQQKNRLHHWVKAEQVVKGQRLRLRGQRIAAADPKQTAPHHYEVLLSVYDEDGKPLPLDEFITTAEAFNLMGTVDRLVLVKTLEWVHTHPRQTAALGGVAINLCGHSLSDQDLVPFIQANLQRLEIPTELVSFEVTETVAIGNLEQAAARIEGIRKLGCRFALDDFGSGLSSYSYLKRLPVDYLKIDGSFVKDMLKHPNDLAIVTSINDIAHFMGKETIAEYVEDQAIRERLYEIGVDYVQGYGIEKPIFLDTLHEPDPAHL